MIPIPIGTGIVYLRRNRRIDPHRLFGKESLFDQATGKEGFVIVIGRGKNPRSRRPLSRQPDPQQQSIQVSPLPLPQKLWIRFFKIPCRVGFRSSIDGGTVVTSALLKYSRTARGPDCPVLLENLPMDVFKKTQSGEQTGSCIGMNRQSSRPPL